MKKPRLLRVSLLLLCLCLVFACTGCGKKDPNPSESEEEEIIYVTRPQSTTEDTGSGATGSGTTGSGANGTTARPSGSGSGGGNGGGTAPQVGTQSTNLGYVNKDRVRDLKGRTITCVAWWDGTDRNTAAGKIMSEVEVLLNCRYVERKMSSYQALYTSILAGAPIADLFCPYDQGTLQLANKGLLTPLDTLSEFNLKEDCWDPATIAETTLNGHVYGISRNFQWRSVLIYNKTMFKANGWEDLYTLQKNGKLTWAKLEEILKKAKSVSGDTVNRYGLVPVYSVREFGLDLLKANGVATISRVGDTTKLVNNLTNNPAATHALTTLQNWAGEKGILYDTRNLGWDSGREVFYTHKAAMALIDYSQLGTILEHANFDMGLVLFPHGPDTANDLVVHSSVPVVIPANVKNPNDVALYWDICRNRMKESFLNDVTPISDLLPDESATATIDRLRKMLKAGQYANAVFNPECITDALDSVALGGSVAQAFGSVSQKINAEMADYWK